MLNKVFYFFISIVPDTIYSNLIFLRKNKRLASRKSGRFTDFLFFKKLDLKNLDEGEVKLRKLVSDRLAVRDYVESKRSIVKLIPVLWSGTDFSHAVWLNLPSRFVIKATHGSQMVKVVDKERHTYDEVFNESKQWFSNDYHLRGREWVYQDTPRNLVIEQFLVSDDGGVPPDFKLFVFGGKLKMIQVDNDRFDGHSRCLYDENGCFLDVKNNLFDKGHPKNILSLVKNLKSISTGIGSDFDFIRVDLYYVGGCFYFGELTNFPGNGLSGYTPDSFDSDLGKALRDSRTSFDRYRIDCSDSVH